MRVTSNKNKMSNMPEQLMTELVRALPETVPFVGPEQMTRERRRPFRARLGANESLFGPSPKAIDAMRAAAAENWMYADPESYELRAAIADHFAIETDEIVVGEGIDGLLGLTTQIAMEPGMYAVTSDGAYPTFNYHVANRGCDIIKVLFNADREDLTALAEHAHAKKARILYVSNPNNPMGTWWTGSQLNELIANLPEGTLLCLDEAYCDTAPADAVPNFDTSNPQVLRFRTFSKAYGLAGARIGFVIGHKSWITAFNKTRNHYGINRVGQVGALAAFQDQPYVIETAKKIASARDTISQIAKDNGLKAIPSATNFVAIDCGQDGQFASRVMNEVLKRDVFIRKPLAPGLDRCIRVTTGPKADLDIFAEVLPEALSAAQS